MLLALRNVIDLLLLLNDVLVVRRKTAPCIALLLLLLVRPQFLLLPLAQRQHKRVSKIDEGRFEFHFGRSSSHALLRP